MCGIYFSISKADFQWPDGKLQQLLCARGPDCQTSCALADPHDAGQNHDSFLATFSTVLSLRGKRVVPQPLRDEIVGLVLCWNGEAWKMGENQISGNDAEVVFYSLVSALTQTVASPTFSRQVVITQILSSVAGPYAFVLYDKICHQVFFGRDALGRRSLLQCHQTDGFILCSITAPQDNRVWTEVDPLGLYAINLTKNTLQNDRKTLPILIPWSLPSTGVHPLQNHVISETNFPMIPQAVLDKSLPSPDACPLTFQSRSVKEFRTKFYHALQLRVLNIPSTPVDDSQPALVSTPKIAVLFSGGLDCTLIARISHDLLPFGETIDLLNVAFENPRIHGNTSSPFDACPDRITGRQTVEELRRVCPERIWRFVEINVPYSETLEHRHTIIQLIRPHNTEMDLSITLALYFAARGIGILKDASTATETVYGTPARVLLSGLGADELFAGYQRHATAFTRRGFEGLLEELELDISRIGKRNLGRDDRVMSHWGREVRYPYLDEDLFTWTLAVPVWQKCGFWEKDLSKTRGSDESETLEPSKKLLRLLACELGMHQVAKEKKRAVGHIRFGAVSPYSALTLSKIQFGTRTAKMIVKKTKGTDALVE